MKECNIETNRARIVGKITERLTFSHREHEEDFYMTEVTVERKSGFKDKIPVIVSEKLINTNKSYMGRQVEIGGEFQSRNVPGECHNRLILFLFAKSFCAAEEAIGSVNKLFLDGYICKEPVHRITPLGREVADVLVAVNRSYGYSDYIPCICWGRNAKYASDLKIGSHVCITGRIQSREYEKCLSEGQVEKRIAYEVSVNGIR